MTRARSRIIHAIGIAFASLVLLLSVPLYERGGSSLAEVSAGGTPANANIKTVDNKGKRIGCDQVAEAKGGVLLGRIMPCLIFTIENTSERFSEAMIDWLMPVVWSFITLMVVIFGLKMLQGEGQLQAQAILFLIKLGFVITVLQMIPHTLIPMTYSIMNEGQSVVMDTLRDSSIGMACDLDRYRGEATPELWVRMDCLVGQLYGFATGTNGKPNMVLASSIFGLISGFFFGGTFGMTVFLIAIGVLTSMLMLVVRIAMAVVNCYLIVALYMFIAPFYLPLLFLRVTNNYFEKWWTTILGALLLPMLISTYVIVALQLYDKVLFANDSLLNQMLSNDLVRKAQALPKKACDKPMTNDVADRGVWTGKALDVLYKSPFMSVLGNPLASGGNNLCAGIEQTNLELTRLAGDAAAFRSSKEAFTKLFQDMIKLLLMAYLIDVGFKTFVNALRPMGWGTPIAASVDAQGKAEAQFQQSMREARAGAMGALRDRETGTDYTGAKFVERIPAAGRDAAKGFFRGITGDKG